MSDSKEKEEEKPIVAKTAVDLQRLKLMKLMKNPEKPVILPERPKAKNTPTVPEFVRNVMGSSAGAGSGEFHVYRHLRRKEYARQKFIQEKGRKELLDAEYHKKLEENKKLADEATAKKRAKRLKKKQKWKQKKRMKPTNVTKNTQEEHTSTEEEEEEEQEEEEEEEQETPIQNNENVENKDTTDIVPETKREGNGIPNSSPLSNTAESEDVSGNQNMQQNDDTGKEESATVIPKDELANDECIKTQPLVETCNDSNRESVQKDSMQLPDNDQSKTQIQDNI